MPDYTAPPSTLPPGSTVWAYLRDSGGPTQDRSIAQQKETLIEYCVQHGLSLERVFSDIHKTGTKDENRDQFRELIAMVEHGQRPDGLLIWSYARFARNELDSQYYKSHLRKHGLVIHSLINDIPEGKFQAVFEALVHVSDQEKAEQAAWESKRGLRYNVKQGAVPGRPPRGIKRNPITITAEDGSVRSLHRWDPDPEVAPLVKQAFALRAAGAGLGKIHAETKLYNSINCYTTFFSNKIYIGTLEFGGETYENYCAPIVDLPTWNAVQTIVEAHADRKAASSQTYLHPRRQNSPFLLAGLAYCARCKSPLVGHSAPRTEKNYAPDICYRCNRRRRRRDCDLPRIPAAAFEAAVLERLVVIAEKPEYIQEMHNEALTKSEEISEQSASKTTVINAELRKIRTQITNTTNAIAEIGHNRALLDKLTTLETERERRELQLRELEAQERYDPDTPENIQKRMLMVKSILENSDRSVAQNIIRGILAAVYVDRDGTKLKIGLDLRVPKKKVIHPTPKKA